MENMIWKKEGVKITNGKRSYTIGTLVEFTLKKHLGTWVVIGVSADGKLMLGALKHVLEYSCDRCDRESIICLTDDVGLQLTKGNQ